MSRSLARAERQRDFSIELDSPPGNPRPYELIEGVLLDTGLEVDDFRTGSPVFGHQTWVLKEGSPEKEATFTNAKPVLKQRITALHQSGCIRYGSW